VAVGTTFAANTVYVATITLIPKTGFTFTGVTANSFTDGNAAAAGVSNPANSGVVTATYAKTTTAPTVVSCKFTDSDTITVVFSEKVNAAIADFTAGAITYPAPEKAIAFTQIDGNLTDTISLIFTTTAPYANGLTVGEVTMGVGITAVTGLQPLVLLTDYVIAAGGF